MNANPQGEERRLPARVAWPGAGILTPLASIMLLHDSGRSLPAAALAVALLSLGVHRLVWWRPDPFQAWQRVLISLVIGTIAYCLAWVMPAHLLGILGGTLKS
jgi:hypothetical protein